MKLSASESTGPGKFSCRADERAYRISLDGCDESLGDSEGFGWYGLLGPIFGLAKVGAILSEDSQGFICVDYYDAEEALQEAWSAIEASYEAYESTEV